jgi:HEAT repeat protein
MSQAWNRFDAFFLNANSWEMRKDGYPGDLIDALSPEEKDRAKTILMERLDGRDDWPIRAMAQLGVTDSVARLRELLLPSHDPVVRAVAATSIYELAGDASMDSIVANIARAPEVFWGSRIDAIYCLARFKTDTAIKTLAELKKDPDYLIRYNAKRAVGEISV